MSIFTRMLERLRSNWFLEALLIVFSVLFALFINDAWENRKTHLKKEEAHKRIIQEINHNDTIITDWIERHTFMLRKIDTLLKDKQSHLWSRFIINGKVNPGALTGNRATVDELIGDAAFETAKSTGIVNEFSYDDLQLLTSIYDLQKVMVDKSLMALIDLYFEKSTHDVSRVNETLLVMRLHLWNVVGQENAVQSGYRGYIKRKENDS